MVITTNRLANTTSHDGCLTSTVAVISVSSSVIIIVAGDIFCVAVTSYYRVNTIDVVLSIALEIILGIVEHLASSVPVLVGVPGVTRRNRRVVQEVQQAPAVLGEDDLLLGAFNDGSEFGLVGLLQLFTSLLSCQQTSPTITKEGEKEELNRNVRYSSAAPRRPSSRPLP